MHARQRGGMYLNRRVLNDLGRFIVARNPEYGFAILFKHFTSVKALVGSVHH
jgi:hypothetical protein